MNLFLHNIGDFDSNTFILPADALAADTGVCVDYVLANTPDPDVLAAEIIRNLEVGLESFREIHNALNKS